MYRIKRSQAGHLYALRLGTHDDWEYAPGATRHDLRPLTRLEAIAIGRRTRTCAACGATLTDPVSIERGLGRECARYFG